MDVPLYEYACRKCGKHTERIEKFDGPALKKCPECGGGVERVVSAPAIQFKGTGWYVTDYARSGSRGDTEKSDGAKASAKAEAKPEEKPAAKESKKPATKQK
jgi:putative FmdB family regulatory protein